MAFDNFLADRIKQDLDQKKIFYVDKKMMGGLCFMVDDKMCLGIVKDALMCRIGPEAYENALKKGGVEPMDFTGRPMKGYVFVQPDGIDLDEELSYWIDLCLAFNPLAKASKKKKSTTKK